MRYIAVNCKFSPQQHKSLQDIVAKYGFSSVYELLKLLGVTLIQYTDNAVRAEGQGAFADLFNRVLSSESRQALKNTEYNIVIAINQQSKSVQVLNTFTQTVSASSVRVLRLVVDTLFPSLADRLRSVSELDNYAKVLCNCLDEYIDMLNREHIRQSNDKLGNGENKLTDAFRPKRADKRNIYTQDAKKQRLHKIDERGTMAEASGKVSDSTPTVRGVRG